MNRGRNLSNAELESILDRMNESELAGVQAGLFPNWIRKDFGTLSNQDAARMMRLGEDRTDISFP